MPSFIRFITFLMFVKLLNGQISDADDVLAFSLLISLATDQRQNPFAFGVGNAIFRL